MTAIPAYGRDYSSRQAVLDDWDANKDFLVQSYNAGGYINKQEALIAGIRTLNIRYNKLRRVAVVVVNP